jgi:uncharacterized protein with ATP-grasp and redox domains
MSEKTDRIIKDVINSYLISRSLPTYTNEILRLPVASLNPGHYPINKAGESFKLKLNYFCSHFFKTFWGKLLNKKLLLMYYGNLYPLIKKKLRHDESELNRYVFHCLLEAIQNNLVFFRLITPISFFHLISTVIYHPKLINIDIYEDIKKEQNNTCYRLLEEINEEIISHKTPIKYIIYLILRSNWIDSYYYNNEFLTGFIQEVCENIDDSEALNTFYRNMSHSHLSKFINIIKSKKTILYELDNSGEVIFDLFFCTMLIKMGHTVYISAKFTPTLNDVTFTELFSLIHKPLFLSLKESLNKRFFIIHANSRVIGKILNDLSKEYISAYIKCDVLFLKGQANFESMPIGLPYKKPIVYMFGIKSKEVNQSIRIATGMQTTIEHPFLYIKY